MILVSLFDLPEKAREIFDNAATDKVEILEESKSERPLQTISSNKACNLCDKYFDTLQELKSHYKSSDHLKKLQESISENSEDEEFEPDKDDNEDNNDEDNNLMSVFKSKDTTIRVHKSVLYPPSKIVKSEVQPISNRMRFKLLLDDKRPYWSFITLSGGYFAGAVFENLSKKAVVHKTIHKYTVRRKQGGNQKTKDKSKSIKSAGSSLRRENEKKLEEEVVELLNSWITYLDNSSLIWIAAPGFNKQTIMGSYVFRSNDPRLRNIPNPNQRPSFEILKRCYEELVNVELIKES